MENFKIDIFKLENKNKAFPDFQKVAQKDSDLFKKFFAKKAGLNENEPDSILILKRIREKSILIEVINKETEDFNFKLLINKLHISAPEHININWFRFDDIDRFKFVDFINNFKFIWYPGPDDIDVFPDDLSWIISIDESGYVYLLC